MSQRDVLELAYRDWTRIPNYQRVQAPERAAFRGGCEIKGASVGPRPKNQELY
jgi:hypothetical protein